MTLIPTIAEVRYHPPKSSAFGHNALARNPRDAWRQTQAFLETCTIHHRNSHAQLRVWGASNWTDGEVSAQCVRDATQLFQCSPDVSGIIHNWYPLEERLCEAIEFALLDAERPKQKLGPVELHFSYSLTWKRHPALPSGNVSTTPSHLGVYIGGRKVFLQPTFYFPLDGDGEDLRRFIRFLQDSLPFQLRNTCFTQLIPSLAGKPPRRVKLPPDWLAA